MRHFEDMPEEKDNLGNNPEFVPLDELAKDTNLRPDEILMQKEEEEVVSRNVFDIDDIDNEPSNWEDDVENGKYDELQTQKRAKEIEINPVRSETRRNLSGIEDEKKKDRGERFYDYPDRNINNSKPKRPEDARDSIRFDEAV